MGFPPFEKRSFRYNKQSPIPISFYDWQCPTCGDISSDPQSVHDSACHNGHAVTLTVTDDGAYEEMVATPTGETLKL